jgi:uncharacterized protein (DUF58 family)
MVREFAREDERRVMLVLDPFIGTAAAADHMVRFERAVSLTACIAWHFQEIHSVMQFRTASYSTLMAPAGEIVYDALRQLALVQPEMSDAGGAFLDSLTTDREIFKIILTARAQKSIPAALWSSSYFIFVDRL